MLSICVAAAMLRTAVVLSTAPALSASPAADPADDPRLWGRPAAGACPLYCACYRWPPEAGAPEAAAAPRQHGQRRVECVGQQLVDVDLGLPVNTVVADLSENFISVLDAGCFQKLGLVQLRELKLSHNAIRDVHPWAFAGLRWLRYLDLSDNHLEALLPNTFAGNRGLQTLLLAGNNLARVPYDAPLLRAPRLQVLDLSDCKLAHVGPSFFADLPALASLNLSANYLIQLQPQAVARQRQLQELDLTRNPLACDVNTRQTLQQLRARTQAANMSVRHSCPPTGAPGAGAGGRQSDRLLLEAMAGAGTSTGGLGVRANGDDGVGEEHDMDTLRQPVGGGRQRAHEHESMVAAPGSVLDAEPGSDYFEEDSVHTADVGGAVTVGNSDRGRSCTPLFPERNTRNPDILKDWFDSIPSFWASVFGVWIGLVLGLVLSSCACHPEAFWRSLYHGSSPGPSSRNRNRNWNRRRDRRPRHFRAQALEPEVSYAELEAQVLSPPRRCLSTPSPSPSSSCRSLAPLRGSDTGGGGVGDGDVGVDTPSSTPARVRPETPPPAYHDLVRVGLCQPQPSC